MRGVKLIGNRKEYSETIIHACGHRTTVLTMDRPLLRAEAAAKRQGACPRCLEMGATAKGMKS